MTGVTHLTPSLERDPNRPPQDSAETRRRLARLIEAVSAGDRTAFRRLYDLSARFVLGIVLAVLRDRGLAEDVAQEVYVTIWKRAASFDAERGNPLAWMAAIARNRAIDRLRAERARGFVAFTAEVPDVLTDDRDGFVTVEALAVRRALLKLRPEFRQAVMLSYFQGYTHSELAAVMDVPAGTAKSWVRRGLAALKEALE